MPRIALVCVCLVGGCFFDAHYRSGEVHCGDGKCPSGLSCRETDHVCVEHLDGGVDVMLDGPDAHMPALICGDPGTVSVATTMTGSTAMQQNTVSPQCNTGVMNGRDAVYKIELPAGKQVTLSVATTMGTYPVAAYMVAPCGASTCLGSAFATPGNNVTIATTTTTPQFIVVDSITAGAGGPYSLTVTVN